MQDKVVRSVVYAVSKLHFVELRRAHVEPLKHLEDVVAVVVPAERVDVERVVQQLLALVLRQARERLAVEVREDFEAGQVKDLSIGELACDARASQPAK